MSESTSGMRSGSDVELAQRGSLIAALTFWRGQYEGRIYVPDHWRFKIGPCCEYHRMSIHVGPFIWRWSSDA